MPTAFEVSPTHVDALASADRAVIVTDHSAYDWDAIAEKARLVVDTRRALPKQSSQMVASA